VLLLGGRQLIRAPLELVGEATQRMPRPSQRGQGLALQPYSPLELLAVAKPLAASRLGALGVSLLVRAVRRRGPLDIAPAALHSPMLGGSQAICYCRTQSRISSGRMI